MDNSVMDFEVLKLIAVLYKNVRFSRSDVQDIIQILSNFIKNVYSPILLKSIQDSLQSAISSEVQQTIERIFQNVKNPFEGVSTEDTRLRVLQNLGWYVPPELHILKKEREVLREKGDVIYLAPKEVPHVHLSIKHSLSCLLSIENLFPALIDYMKTLYREKSGLQNIIQGTLWQNVLKEFSDSDIVIPIQIGHGDFESGNALGSHSGNQSICAMYATIPCFPPNFASKLESIFITDLFYTKHKKNTLIVLKISRKGSLRK